MEIINNKPIILLVVFWIVVFSPLWLILLAPEIRSLACRFKSLAYWFINKYKEKSFTDYTQAPQTSYIPKKRIKEIKQISIKISDDSLKPKIRSAVMPNPNIKAPKFKEFLD